MIYPCELPKQRCPQLPHPVHPRRATRHHPARLPPKRPPRTPQHNRRHIPCMMRSPPPPKPRIVHNRAPYFRPQLPRPIHHIPLLLPVILHATLSERHLRLSVCRRLSPVAAYRHLQILRMGLGFRLRFLWSEHDIYRDASLRAGNVIPLPERLVRGNSNEWVDARRSTAENTMQFVMSEPS